MTEGARLSVTDEHGRRTVLLDKPVFLLGRRTSADLQVTGRDTSREHAEIVRDADGYLVRDCGSRFGTFVNGEAVSAPRMLQPGDRIQLGHASGAEIVFLGQGDTPPSLGSSTNASDLGQLAAVLNGLRALGSGRVLDEVLTLVLDSALDVTTADRAFVMLADLAGALQFTAARAKGHQTLAGTTFATSHKIPRQVFETGKSLMVRDLMEGDLAGAHHGTIAVGIRHVLCVPLLVTPQAARNAPATAARAIGVLYLDGRERDVLLSSATRSSLEAFATQAALAIEGARLYAESAEKAKLDRDLRLAAEMQRALLPAPVFEASSYDLAAVTVPCRTVGGDFYDYIELGEGQFGFTLGDVAGKGPSAALLASSVQSNFAAQAPVASDPADLMARLNRALLRRAVDARFATMFYGSLAPGGHLAFANAGQEPPVLVRRSSTEALEEGGPVLGLLSLAQYAFATATLEPGDVVVICSDGITEAVNLAGDEFGRDRLVEMLAGSHGDEPLAVLERVVAAVRAFVATAPQNDDITAMVVRYKG